MNTLVHVVVAVIRDKQGRILIARRPKSVHQGGKLEFPGGKVELGETVPQALRRELYEELGIQCVDNAIQPLIKIIHHYTDKSICLDVWQVLEFSGKAYGKEDQAIFWLEVYRLKAKDFPAANAPIITALNLPSELMISPDIIGDVTEVIAEIKSRIDSHIVKAVILRLPRISPDNYVCIAEQLVKLYPQVCWQIHSDIALAKRLGTGLHLSSSTLDEIDVEELKEFSKLSASIHNIDELKQAEALGVDFAVLSSVQVTTTHPNIDILGWTTFTEIVEVAHIPIYALGGMQKKDLLQALCNGAQGIAGIDLFVMK